VSETVELNEEQIKALIGKLQSDVEQLSGLERADRVIEISKLRTVLIDRAHKIPNLARLDAKELKELTEKAAKADANAAQRMEWFKKIISVALPT